MVDLPAYESKVLITKSVRYFAMLSILRHTHTLELIIFIGVWCNLPSKRIEALEGFLPNLERKKEK